jgi:hypothetical protein
MPGRRAGDGRTSIEEGAVQAAKTVGAQVWAYGSSGRSSGWRSGGEAAPVEASADGSEASARSSRLLPLLAKDSMTSASADRLF